jgi:hypothetical protein
MKKKKWGNLDLNQRPAGYEGGFHHTQHYPAAMSMMIKKI